MNTNPHAEAARHYMEYAIQNAEPRYRAVLAVLYPAAIDFIGRYLRGEQSLPHLRLGRTASKNLSHLAPFTGFGARWEITINEGLVLNDREQGLPNRTWVQNPWPSPCLIRFVTREVEKQLACQYVREIEGQAEAGYGGFGPRFCAIANRVNQERGWLHQVVSRHRGRADEAGTFLGKHWPHACELAHDPNAYGDDVLPAAIALAVGTPNTRAAPASTPPSLGVWDYILFLLAAKGPEAVRELAQRQADWLEQIQKGVFPLWRAVEAGDLEPDNKTPIDVEVPFEADWLTSNNGIAEKMVRSIRAFRTYHELPILADALEDAGCCQFYILQHLRARIQHDSTCWVMKGLQKLLPKTETAESDALACS